jgi:hypothetical protein
LNAIGTSTGALMVVADATVNAFRREGVRIEGICREGKVNLFVIKVRLKAQDGQMNGENASRRANWTGRRLVGGIGRCVRKFVRSYAEA